MSQAKTQSKASMLTNRLKIDIPDALAFFVKERARFKGAYGGRGGMKSTTVAQSLLLLGLQRRIKVLCTREFQSSIKESVHSLLEEQIDLFNLRSFYDPKKQEITGKNGTEFLFAGLHHNVSSLKSFNAADICWVEEGETISENSWSVLTPTIRKPGSEIWVTFNPDQPDDPTFARFVKNPKDVSIPKLGAITEADGSWRSPTGTPASQKYIIKRVYWWQNKWLSEESKHEAREMMRTDPDAYAHIWGGECWTRSDAQVFNGKWVIDEFTPDASKWDGPYFGADWGFSRDPTVLIKLWIHEKALYVEREKYGTGIDTAATPELFDQIEGSRTHKIRADCSRPETISAMVNAGFDCEGADKWSGSVEDGIQFIRGFAKIVISPRCKHFIQEARLYSYKTDRLTGDVLPIVLDKHNHGWDAVRYALEPIIKNTGPDGFSYYK